MAIDDIGLLGLLHLRTSLLMSAYEHHFTPLYPPLEALGHPDQGKWLAQTVETAISALGATGSAIPAPPRLRPAGMSALNSDARSVDMMQHQPSALSMRNVLCSLLVALSCLSAPAFARPHEDFDAAVAAYRRGDYAAAVKLLKPLAEQGDARAQFNLGFMCDKGRGVPQDYATALSWYRKAAEQGHSSAQTNLGFMYSQGRGVPQDYATALSWYRKAAEQGDAKAQFNLGLMYAQGQGVTQDYATALSWYRKAAEQGDATAQFNLGLMYAQGLGMPQDKVLAYKWVSLAASRLAASEKKGRDDAVDLRDQIASKMTAAQIDEAQKLARDWRPKPER